MIIIFDFDSTLVTIEGIDVLAEIKGMGEEIASMTESAMAGHASLEEVYEKRLETLRPSRRDLLQLGDVYMHSITPGARMFVQRLVDRHDVFIVSSGLKLAIDKCAHVFGIHEKNIFANTVIFDELGMYESYDHVNPLTRSHGKRDVIEQIEKNKNEKTILIGDGYNDFEARESVDTFICYTGNIERKSIAKRSSYTVKSFEEDVFMSILQ